MRFRAVDRGAIIAWLAFLRVFLASFAGAADPTPPDSGVPDEGTETITILGRQPLTATSTQTIPAEDFELRPLESGGQLLEAVPNVLTAQHTGGGKAEQYFLRGFDADHGTDLAVYFDGVPVNLRSHAHGQGYLDLHFVTPETVDRLDAHKGTYFTRFGDFATAAAIEYVPAVSFDESLVKISIGEFETFRAVGVAAPRTGIFAEGGPARGYASFEAYHTDGPFDNPENLWRYSFFARGELDVGPDLTLSAHLLGYYADWNASGLIPRALVQDGSLNRFGSLDPSEGGDTTRAQGKIQVDWRPHANAHLMANAYVSYYDFELFSNFTYFLDDPVNGDGIVQRDKDRIFAGGRIEYVHLPDTRRFVQLRAGLETRFDDAEVFLGDQTQRRVRETTSDDELRTLSIEPYADVEVDLLSWLSLHAGLRFAWFHFDGRDELAGQSYRSEVETRWLPKANLRMSPFSPGGPIPVDVEGIRNLELFANFGLGYHSNDARAVLSGSSGEALPRAIGAELGLRTSLFDRIELAVDGWFLNLEDELRFVGDEGTTEPIGETNRLGVEVAATVWPLDWWYARGDVAYTSARLDDGNTQLAQAPRVVAKAATGIRYEGFAAELNLKHLGERLAIDGRTREKLQDYTVLDFAARYRLGPIEVGFSVENLTDTNWSSSEFYYESRPDPAGEASEDFHFSPGNSRNFRGWITGYF